MKALLSFVDGLTEGQKQFQREVVRSQEKSFAPKKPVPKSEFSCRVCGKPTDGAFVCKACAEVTK